MPELLAEMREDLAATPLAREIIVKRKAWIYNGDPDKPVLVYHLDEHDDLLSKLRILENYGLIRDIKYNSVDRFVMEEALVAYLTRGSENRT